MASWAGAIASPSGSGSVQYTTELKSLSAVFFMAVNSTSTGFVGGTGGDAMYWHSFGIAAYSDLAHTALLNGCRTMHVVQNTAQQFGSGLWDSRCIEVRSAVSTSVITASVTDFDEGAFTINWSTSTAGYTIYYLALPECESYASFGMNGVSLTAFDKQIMGSMMMGHGYPDFGYNVRLLDMLTAQNGFASRPSGLESRAGQSTAARSLTLGSSVGHSEVFGGLPGDLVCIWSDAWIAGTLLDGWVEWKDPGQEGTWYHRGPAVYWATTEIDSFYAGALWGDVAASTYYDAPQSDGGSIVYLKPEFGITAGNPRHDAWAGDDGEYLMGMSIGFWSADANFHATTAIGKQSQTGEACIYHDDQYSWMASWELSGGLANAGRLSNEATLGYVRVHGDVADSPYAGQYFAAWLGTLPDFVPQLYRWWGARDNKVTL
jgi:hypothetical protein